MQKIPFTVTGPVWCSCFGSTGLKLDLNELSKTAQTECERSVRAPVL